MKEFLDTQDKKLKSVEKLGFIQDYLTSFHSYKWLTH